MLVFSGDIGGTSTRMQLTEFPAAGEMQVVHSIHFANSKYPNFAAVIDAFFAETKVDVSSIASACFGVAGPIVHGDVQCTNLPWIIKTNAIKEKLKLAKVAIINDFVAVGYGLEILKPENLLTLQEGKPRRKGVKAYIGAGTGLGVGFLTYHDDGSYSVYPTEGGHVDFAPTDETQVELLKYLRKKYHRTSFERVLSGQGLVNIYHFVREHKIFGEEENLQLRFLIESDQNIDIAATVAEYAIKHQDIMAMRALDIFIRIYGVAVGNLALTTLPFGGLYIVGGIAPKLLEQIQKGHFLENFGDKGRMSNLIKDVPLHVVLYPGVGLQGTAVYAKKIAC